MSSCSGSVCSFDAHSELTLLYGETFIEDDSYKKEKTAFDIESNAHLSTASSAPLLFSTSFLAQCLACLSDFVWFFAPSFIQSWGQKDAREENLYTTAYLDGMRGLAAFAVFLCHLSYRTWDTGHVYGTGGFVGIHHILRLPIVRLLYAGPPMVAIFFVISGFALSHKPVKLMRVNKYRELMLTMTSSVFRRALRLFLPCFASTFLVGILCQLDCYKKTEEFARNMRVISEEHAWTEPDPLSQLVDWARQMGRFVNVFDWSLYAGSTVLDSHLWTIPAEFRCSMSLFLTHLLTARMSTAVRILTITGLLLWGIYWDRWELVPFWAGALLAETSHIHNNANAHSLHIFIWTPFRGGRHMWWKVLYFLNFFCGLYLASFPDVDGHVTPGYIYLNSLIPEFWTEKHRFWPTVAAVQIVWSVSMLEPLQTIFTSSIPQYIGRISFPLYLMHGPIIHTFGYLIMKRLYAYTGTEDRALLGIGFAVAASFIAVVVVWVSDIFWRLVDQPSVKFAKWLEGRLFVL